MSNDHDAARLSSMSLVELERFDAICTKFEQQLRDRQQPQIEDFLDASSGDEVAALLREMLHLELTHKESRGLSTTQIDYETRFSKYDHVVREIFSARSQSSDPLRDYTGQLVAGRYQVNHLLGTGASSDVYLALDSKRDGPVALKILRPNVDLDATLLLGEAETLARLDHPNIVDVYDWGTVGAVSFIALQYIDGKTLAEELLDGTATKRATMAADGVVDMISPICDALSYAHENGLTHRDIKPHNILVDRQGQPYVADFGFALHESLQDQHYGDRSGTPYFRSPEQVRGEADWIDGRADIWSLGVVMYQLLTGRRPFGGDSIDEIDRQILGRSPKPPRQIDPTIPEWLEAVVQKCLSPSPADRYATASELAQVLRRKTHPLKSLRWSRRLTIGVSTLLLVLGLVAAGAIGFAQSQQKARAAAENVAVATIESVIRNIVGELKRGPRNVARRRLIDNCLTQADDVASQSRWAELMRVTTREKLAKSLMEVGGTANIDEAESLFADALQILQRLKKESDPPAWPPYLRLLGNIEDSLGKIDRSGNDDMKALAHFQQALAYRKDWLKITESGKRFAKCSPFRNPAKNADPEAELISEHEHAQQAIGESYLQLGQFYRNVPQERDEAEKCFRALADLRGEFSADHPNSLRAKRDYAGARRDLGTLRNWAGDYAGAYGNIEEAIRLTCELIEDGEALENNENGRKSVGEIDLLPPKANAADWFRELGVVLMRSGCYADASDPLQESVDRLTLLMTEYADHPQASFVQKCLAKSWYCRGIQLLETNPIEAQSCFSNSIQLSKGIAKIKPLARMHKREKALSLIDDARAMYAGRNSAPLLLEFARCYAACAWSAQYEENASDYAAFRNQAIAFCQESLEAGIEAVMIRDDPEMRFLFDDPVFRVRLFDSN